MVNHKTNKKSLHEEMSFQLTYQKSVLPLVQFTVKFPEHTIWLLTIAQFLEAPLLESQKLQHIAFTELLTTSL